MQVGDAGGAHIIAQRLLFADGRPGLDLLDDERFQRRLATDLAADAHAFQHRRPVAGTLQEIETYLGRGQRIGRLQPHRAAAVRPEVHRTEREG